MSGILPIINGGSGSGNPQLFRSNSIGSKFSIASQTPTTFLVEDAGAPLGFDVPAQPAGTWLTVFFSGTMSNNGNTDHPQIVMTVNGTPVNALPFGSICFGGGACAQSQILTVELPASQISEIRFTIFSFDGNEVGTYPNHPSHGIPSAVYVYGMLSAPVLP